MSRVIASLLFLSTAFLYPVDAQNLVPNESFEEFLVCPKRVDHVRQLYIASWQQATAGSIDYFHACSATCGTPYNAAGSQKPKTGEGYIGLYACKSGYREYAQAKLNKPLIKGTTYYVEFSASLAESSGLACNGLGALITVTKISSRNESTLECLKVTELEGRPITEQIVCQPQVTNTPTKIMEDCKEWFTISGTFVATGGEQYITIGNFYDIDKTETKVIDAAKDQAAYYFIDDVMVVEGTQPLAIVFHPREGEHEKQVVPGELLASAGGTKNILEPTALTIQEKKHTVSAEDYFELALAGQAKALPKTPIVLENIVFAPNDYAILPKSQAELMKLVDFMQKNPKIKIEIGGHTDDTGTAEFNQELSENRAKAVFNFLVMEDIDDGRLSYKGYGNSQQIDKNGDAITKGQNRRVEFKIIGQ